jgi:hypothetical protein
MKRARSWLLGAALAVSALAIPVHVDAAPPKPLVESLAGDAKAAYESGRVLYADGDYPGAIAKFQRAYDLSPDPRLLWNMAACEKQLRHYTKVLRLVDRYLAEGGALLSPKDRTQATEFATAVRAFVAEVTITCNETGATLYVDDEKIGVAPLTATVLVDQGSRKFRAAKPDFHEGAKTEVIDGGSKRTIAIELQRLVHEARLAVHASPGDAIAIDGQVLGHGEWSGKVKTGPHVVEVTAPGKKSRRYEQVLRDDESKSIDVVLENEASSTKWPWYVGGAVVAVGVVVGGYFLLRPAKDGTSPPTEGTLGVYQLP